MQKGTCRSNGLCSESPKNIYRQHIKQPQYQQLAIEKYLRTCGDQKFHMFPFFKILQEDKSLRKPYEELFIEKFLHFLDKLLCSIKNSSQKNLLK